MVLQLKITLTGSKPPIWRRLLVSGEMTLQQLHHALQLAFEWENCHLHEFKINGKSFGEPDPDMYAPVVNEAKVRLATALGKVGDKGTYNYDFGDDWLHQIVVEKILKPELGVDYPVCVAGKRRGPSEDCGGIHGYYNLIDAIEDPQHPDHEDMSEWVGGALDPEEFSIDVINERLRRLFPSKSRSAQHRQIGRV